MFIDNGYIGEEEGNDEKEYSGKVSETVVSNRSQTKIIYEKSRKCDPENRVQIEESNENR